VDRKRLRPWLYSVAFLLGACWVGVSVQAGPAQNQPVLQKALELASKGHYREALPLFDAHLSKDSSSSIAREGRLSCVRHIQQQRRHRERGFRDAILSLKRSGQVLDVYARVLLVLQSHYVERDKTEAARLFQQGLLELRYALDDEAFRKEYLAKLSPEAIAAFRERLASWPENSPQDNDQARDQLRKVARSASETLGLSLPVVAFEFVCGACNSLDEYTAYLTPAQANEMQAMLRGKFAGVGVELAQVDDKLVIAQIHPDSPAAKTLKVGDRVVRIDRQAVDPSLLGEARARLRGEPGSMVEIEVQPAGEMGARPLKLERQPYVMPSVEFEPEPREGIGYVRVLNFTDTTVQELKDAILKLQTSGIRGMILDLRGNPGGLFKASVQVAEMFLPEGLIVHTQSRQDELNAVYRSHNPNALTLPLVLLVDGETASSAEVLAGALKENERARLVGQPTFGKGTIQWIVPLQIVSAGVKITVARFLSPSGQPYSERGVTPHVIVEVVGDSAQNEEAIRSAAMREARQLVMMMPREE
jgi:carboxyl-terminal processing protease